MDKDAIVSVRVSKETKEQAERILNESGFSLSNAINVYLTEIARSGHPLFALIPEMREKEPIDNVLLFDEIKQYADDVLNHALPYKDKIIKVYLFGSYAKKEATAKSDVDIHVVSDGTMSLSELIDLQNRLKNALGKEADAVGSSTISEPSPFIKRIQGSEVLLYEKRKGK
jgi:predicted nucleotidyltransferase